MPKQYADIHTHILPHVDDGSRSFDASLEMLRMEKEQGVKLIVLTPHFVHGRNRYTPRELLERFDEFQENEKVRDTGIELILGNEIYYSDSIVDDLDKRHARTIDGSGKILLEFDPSASYERIRYGCKIIYNSGYHIILAHIERYANFSEKLADELLDMEVEFQMNAGSIPDAMKLFPKPGRLYKDLLKEGLISYIATDAHNTNERKPDLDTGYIERKIPEYTEDMLWNNARKFIKER